MCRCSSLPGTLYVTNNRHALEKWMEVDNFLKRNRFFVNNESLNTELDFFKYFMDGLPEWQLTCSIPLFRARRGIYLSKEQLTAPPESIIRDGRLNPAGVRYLYLSDSKITASYEVRPCNGSWVTTVELQVKDSKPLRIADFCRVKPEKKPNDYRYIINQQFSLPINEGKTEDYRITQCIAEFIRLKGYDGARYDSSVHKGGRNIVIFDPEKMDFKDFEQTREVAVLQKS